jgi:hypothetical protein
MSRHEPGDIVWHGWFFLGNGEHEVGLDPCSVVEWSEHNSEVRHLEGDEPAFWVGNEVLYDSPEQFQDHAASMLAKLVLEISKKIKAAKELVAIHQYRNAQ